MMTIMKSTEKGLETINRIEDGAWVNLVNPDQEELTCVREALGIDADMLNAALDEEERARFEAEDNGHVLILVDVPFAHLEHDNKTYATFPLAIIVTKECIVTVCLKPSPIIEAFLKNSVKTFYTYKKSRFVLQILYRTAALYLGCLREIDKRSSAVENELHKSMKNKELIQLLAIEKSLVYFSTSLKSNEIVMEKLSRHELSRKYEEDADLLEDTIIENRQAMEMAKIYSDILSGTMDAYASVISNNLNIVMKFLALITIILSVPTIVFSYFGMNVDLHVEKNPYAVWIILGITIILSFAATWIMNMKKMFK